MRLARNMVEPPPNKALQLTGAQGRLHIGLGGILGTADGASLARPRLEPRQLSAWAVRRRSDRCRTSSTSP